MMRTPGMAEQLKELAAQADAKGFLFVPQVAAILQQLGWEDCSMQEALAVVRRVGGNSEAVGTNDLLMALGAANGNGQEQQAPPHGAGDMAGSQRFAQTGNGSMQAGRSGMQQQQQQQQPGGMQPQQFSGNAAGDLFSPQPPFLYGNGQRPASARQPVQPASTNPAHKKVSWMG